MANANTDVAILHALERIEAKLQANSPKAEKHNFITKVQAKLKPKKKNAKKANEVRKTYARVELPEGWKAIPGLNALRTEGYNASKKASPKEDWGFHNRQGLLRVQEAIATM